MTTFVQLHTLTAYGPSNLNRDDTGRPKTCTVGGVERTRISSQSLKRAWRTSPTFQSLVGGYLGLRTRRVGEEVEAHLASKHVPEKKAKEAAKAITKLWSDGGKPVLFLFSPTEWQNVMTIAERLASGALKEVKHTDFLLSEDTAVDVALWGRMLASAPQHNVEAACQVAHAFTTHKTLIEDDYFSAVDERPDPAQGSGAGHIDARQFSAGLFYGYCCLNRDLLSTQLSGRKDLSELAIEALVTAVTMVAPSGMRASFGTGGVRADYALVEVGPAQPRSLGPAFYRPVRGDDQVKTSIAALTDYRAALDKSYEKGWATQAVLNVQAGAGTLLDLIKAARA